MKAVNICSPLINDILDLSKIEAGKLEIEPGRVNVHEVCEASLSMIKGMAQTKNLDLQYNIPEMDIYIHADARRLKQILVNLLSNAVKFTPENGMVKLGVIPQPRLQKLKFVVEDNGIGISEEYMQKLFQPFTQLDSSLSREYEGTGLGLALVKRLTNLHNGEVIVESEGIPGKGSRLTIILPWHDISTQGVISTNDSEDVDCIDDENAGESGTTNAENNILVLLAEDNPANATTMSEYLKIVGYRVVMAENGEEAISKAKACLPDVILMDIQMPVMNGLQAIKELRKHKRFKHTPIVALTALAMSGDEQRCLDAGASDYVSKPVKMKALDQKIRAILKTGSQTEI